MRYALAQAGFAGATFEDATIGLSGARIKGLQLDADGNRIGEFSAGYSPASLLQGQLTQLTIRQAHIDLSTPSFQTGGSGSGGGLPAALPVRNIDLADMTILIPTPAGKIQIALSGSGSAQDAMTLQVDGTLLPLSDSAEGRFSGKAGIDFKNSTASFDLGQTYFKSPQLNISEGTGQADIRFTAPIEAKGRIALRNISYAPDGGKPVTVPLNVELDIATAKENTDTDTITATGAVTGGNGLLHAKISARHRIKDGTGSIAIDMPPTTFMPGVYQLADIIPLSSAYAQDINGSMGFTARAEWALSDDPARITTRGKLMLKDVNASVEDLKISGINAVITLKSLAPPVIEKQTIYIQQLDSGLPLTKGILTVGLNAAGKMTLHAASWGLAGGTVTSSAFTVDPKKPAVSATLTASGMELSELFKVAPMDGLSALGKVKGTLPLRLVGEKLSIVDGVLETEGTGNISYNPADPPSFLMDDQNAGIVNLRTALKNFNFDNLKITVNGELGGQQKLQLAIAGRNPEFYEGHAVNLNLNVEGPLENVLRYNPGSNQIPDSIREQIESYENDHAKK